RHLGALAVLCYHIVSWRETCNGSPLRISEGRVAWGGGLRLPMQPMVRPNGFDEGGPFLVLGQMADARCIPFVYPEHTGLVTIAREPLP
ncbi:MAG: hypothetical protein ACUVX9_16515, partial [Anaerolineae bacterium]